MKKIIGKLLCLAFVTIGCLGLGTLTANADTSDSKIKPYSIETKEIGGTFSVYFNQPWSHHRRSAGTLEYVKGNGVLLAVTNGGPSELSWSAMLYNKRTGKQVLTDWAEFKHGTNGLSLKFARNADIRLGDELEVEFTNNNFPSGVGFLQIYGSMRQF